MIGRAEEKDYWLYGTPNKLHPFDDAPSVSQSLFNRSTLQMVSTYTNTITGYETLYWDVFSDPAIK